MARVSPQARALFFELIDVPVEGRAAILAERCSGTPELAAEVSALLAADAEAEGFLEPPAIDLGPDEALAGRWLEGRRIGQYTVGRRIGIGGMGTVYVAQQQRPHRRVALKLLRSGLGTDDLRHRFEREVEILGRLHHPGIAEIYEAGTHDSELGPIPFFALEYIPDACSVTDWADQCALDARARVALFAGVCDAVAHAHAHGVVHRDIKPNNILVGSDGRPRLIDFGIARWNDEASQATVGTQLGDLLGTLRYMSPEQCDADGAIGPTSDVYALGVVLYEMIAGCLPYPLEGVGAGRIAELVRTHQPAPPTRGRTRWRALDAVILMALAKPPAWRYADAGVLAADLRRALAGEPVHATRSQRSYRVRRLFWQGRRAAPWLAAGGAVAIGLAAQRSGQATAETAQTAQTVQAAAVPTNETYLHRVAVAERALATGDLARAKAALDAAPLDQRGWEWRRMHAQVDRSVQVLPIGAPSHALVHDRTRGVLIATSDAGELHAWRSVDDSPVPHLEPSWHVALHDELGSLVLDAPRGVVYVATEHGGIDVRRVDNGDNAGHFAADGDQIVAADLDDGGADLMLLRRSGALQRWNLDAHTEVMTASMERPLGTAVVSHGELFAAVQPGGVAIYGTARGEPRGVLPGEEGVEAIVVEGDTVYVTGWDDRITAYSRSSGAVQRRFEAQPDGMLDLLRTDASTLASAGRDGAIVLWDIESGTPRHRLQGHDFGVDALAMGGGGRWLASVSLDGTMRIWDLVAPTLDHTLHGPHEKLHAIAFASQGSVVVATSGPQWGQAEFGAVTTWSTATGRVLASVQDHRTTVDAVAVSPDGQRVATASRDGELVLRDLDLRVRARVAAHPGRIHAIAFAPDGAHVVTGGDDGTLAVWNADDGAPLQRVDAGVGVIEDVVWTPQEIVAGGAGGLCRSEDRLQGPPSPLAGPSRVTAITVLSGAALITGSDDGTLARIDINTGETSWRTPTFGRAITDVAVSPDGARVATSSQDYGIRLIDAATGEHLLTVGVHESVATTVAFSPDGTTIASGGFDRVARLWQAVTPIALR